MTPDEIFDAFSSRTFPSDAIAACRADKDVSSQILLDLVEDFVKGAVDVDPDGSTRAKIAFCLTIHLLAEFRERRVFPLLMRFLGDDPGWVDEVLGDIITHTLPGILISTFNGDINALHELITNPSAEEYVRSSTLDALAYLADDGAVSRDATQQFLRECFYTFQSEKPSFVWVGWVECIAVLGMESLVTLVETAFNNGVIDPTIMEFKHFQRDIQHTLGLQTQHPQLCTKRTPFNNADELSSWITYTYTPSRRELLLSSTDGSMELVRDLPGNLYQSQPHINPYRDIGRNNPCPCGSGKKFKKCCLE